MLLCPSGDDIQTKKKSQSLTEHNPLAELMTMLQNKSSLDSVSRTTSLTRVLAPSILETKQSHVCLVAAVSPSSVDTETSLSSMISSMEYMKESTASSTEITSRIKNIEAESQGTNDLMLPRQWSKVQLMDWVKRKNLVDHLVEGNLSGKIVMKMSIHQIKECFFSSSDSGDRKAKRLFRALRAENDRVARLRVKRKFALQMAEK